MLALVLPLAQAAGGGLFGSPFLLIAILFGIMYFTMIRPQARQAKLHREMVGALRKGDRVVTAGGLHGTLNRVDETTVLLQVDDGSRIKVERSKVAVVLREGKGEPADTPADAETADDVPALAAADERAPRRRTRR